MLSNAFVRIKQNTIIIEKDNAQNEERNDY